jgi:3-phosphoshikimate 1-carboxyvinyltransferase
MLDSLRALDIPVTLDEADRRVEVTGCRGHLLETDSTLFCGNSGTCMRFLTALVALGDGAYRLDGIARMRKRPIGELCAALQSLGAGIEYSGEEGFPPLTVHAAGLRGGSVEFEAPPSSQMVSALLLVAPYARRDVLIEIRGEVPSRPFLDMTVGVMERFGIELLVDRRGGATRFAVEAPRCYAATALSIEPDATNAMYFLGAAAIAGGRVTIPRLGTASLQGDVGFVTLLAHMGCAVERRVDSLTVTGPARDARLRGIDVDLNEMPDTVPTLAVLALFADSPTTIRNVGNLRLKETDRLAALRTELTRLGATVQEGSDNLVISPPDRIRPAAIDTYDDHRMAMSFALAGLRCPGLRINDARCCAKTFPDFFQCFDAMLQGV